MLDEILQKYLRNDGQKFASFYLYYRRNFDQAVGIITTIIAILSIYIWWLKVLHRILVSSYSVIIHKSHYNNICLNHRTIPTAFDYDYLRSHLINSLIAKFKFDVGFTFRFYNSITCF